MSTELGMPSNHLISLHHLLLLPSIFPSIRVIFSESVLCIRWPKYWSFTFSLSPSNKYSGLTSLGGKQHYLLSLICIPLRRMKQSTLYVPSFHLNSMFLPHHIWLYLFFWLIHIFGYLYYSLEKSHFSITYKSNIFSHFVGFLFLVASFDKQMFLISVKCNIQIFCLFFFVSYLKHSQTHNLNTFSSTHFIISSFIFWLLGI